MTSPSPDVVVAFPSVATTPPPEPAPPAPAAAPPGAELIHAAWARVFADVRAVGKDSWNDTGKGFHFRGIDAVLNAAHPSMARHGVYPRCETRAVRADFVEIGANRTRMRHVEVDATYHFTTVDGSSFPQEVTGEAFDSGDKAISKAYSVALRVALIQALCLPTEERDPDADTYELSSAEQPQRPAQGQRQGGQGQSRPAQRPQGQRPPQREQPAAAAEQPKPELTFEQKVRKTATWILGADTVDAAQTRVAYVADKDLDAVACLIAPSVREWLPLPDGGTTLGQLAVAVLDRLRDSADQAKLDAQRAEQDAAAEQPDPEPAPEQPAPEQPEPEQPESHADELAQLDEQPDPDGVPLGDDPWANAPAVGEPPL